MSTTPPREKRYLRASEVRKRYAGISDMTLWRWLNDADLNFPQPEYHGRDRFWDEALLDAHDRECARRTRERRARRSRRVAAPAETQAEA
jgi:predicted DNA-binding transcriptional regulator AlpA